MSRPKRTPPPAPEASDPFYFKTVPVGRQRRNGWTPDVQVVFIRALARTGSVTQAARVVGRSVRGAYALRGREGAAGFACAWDMALDFALGELADRLCAEVKMLERGEQLPLVPVRHRRTGAVVGWRCAEPDLLLMRALRALDRQTGEQAARAIERIETRNRKRHLDRLEREMMAEYVAQRAEQERAEAEAQARRDREAAERLTPEQRAAVQDAWDRYVAGLPQKPPKAPRRLPRAWVA